MWTTPVPPCPSWDRITGELRQAQVFVAVLGASNYTYVEATWTQGLDDWLMAHVRAFAFFGGVPEIVVPDNLKTGVQTPHRYEPDLNPSYLELAAHYGVAVPARVRKPRDKAKAESGVLVVERWILARLRHRTLFSLDELNTVIRELRDALNQRAFKNSPVPVSIGLQRWNNRRCVLTGRTLRVRAMEKSARQH
ncbi:MAG: IS21 family transposase [Gammaproteobacteria bacterium]|nr:IS21 family transposase [Gammaproteobacteria bacterium]